MWRAARSALHVEHQPSESHWMSSKTTAHNPADVPGSWPEEGGVDLSRKARPGESVVMFLLRAAALVSVLTTVGIVVSLTIPAIAFFRKVRVVDFLTGSDWSPNFSPQSFGVLPIVSGTLVVTAI